MAAGPVIAPLTNSQKLFLQRLLVEHVLTDAKANEMYESIKETFADVAPERDDEEEADEDGTIIGGGGGSTKDEGYMGNSLTHCLGIINASLVPAFNLEVCTVSLPPPYDDDDDDDDDSPERRQQQSSQGSRKRTPLTKYHSIVNRSNDAVARSHAFPLSKGGPHEMAYFRLALERIVERGAEILEEGGPTTSSNVGCPGSLNRMELINLRTELEGNHEGKLTIAQVEGALEVMEAEGWLARVAPPADDDSDDEDDEEEDDDDEEEGSSSRSKRKRKKKRPSSAKSSGGSRRKSLKGTFYGVGPRSFMELGEFLQKAGLPGDRMPQSILHRV